MIQIVTFAPFRRNSTTKLKVVPYNFQQVFTTNNQLDEYQTNKRFEQFQQRQMKIKTASTAKTRFEVGKQNETSACESSFVAKIQTERLAVWKKARINS